MPELSRGWRAKWRVLQFKWMQAMSQARFVPGHKNIWRCKGTRKMCKWQTEIIQPKTEHSTAAATESDMNYSVLQAHRTKFFPGEGGRDDLPPNHISKTNVLTFLISHEISVVSPRPSVITRKTCDFHCRSCVIWIWYGSPLCRRPFQFYLHT